MYKTLGDRADGFTLYTVLYCTVCGYTVRCGTVQFEKEETTLYAKLVSCCSVGNQQLIPSLRFTQTPAPTQTQTQKISMGMDMDMDMLLCMITCRRGRGGGGIEMISSCLLSSSRVESHMWGTGLYCSVQSSPVLYST